MIYAQTRMAVTRIVSLSVCLLSVTTCLKPYEYRDCLFEPLPYLGPDQAVVYLFITREDVVNEASHVRISVDGSFVTGLLWWVLSFRYIPAHS